MVKPQGNLWHLGLGAVLGLASVGAVSIVFMVWDLL